MRSKRHFTQIQIFSARFWHFLCTRSTRRTSDNFKAPLFGQGDEAFPVENRIPPSPRRPGLAVWRLLWHNNLMSRWFLFLITITLGIGAGLFYGWRIHPLETVVTSPSTLRDDYKTDYVLMVAEAYHAEGDLATARARLALLGEEPPAQLVANAIQYAATIQPPYAGADLALMQALANDLKAIDPAREAQGQ